MAENKEKDALNDVLKSIEEAKQKQFIMGMTVASRAIESVLTDRRKSFPNRITEALRLCKQLSHPNLDNLKENEVEPNQETNSD